MKLPAIALTLVSLALYGAAVAGDTDVHAMAHKVDEHYNHLHTMEAEFTESYRGMGVDRVETGTLWLKKPGKMRWEYRSPREKLFISDGKDAWFYLPGDRQVRKTEVRKLDDLRSPLAFLLGKTHLEKELRGLSLAPDQTPVKTGNVVLRGVPKNLEDRVSEILLEVTPEGEIVRIQVDEVDGGTTEYRFSQEKENVEVADHLFHFAVPAGVEVVDGEFGQ
jgi:outer membrane lipoprotein carrier protein